MKITTKYVVGDVEYVLEVDEKSEMDTLHKSIILSNPPLYCNECKNAGIPNFRMTTNKDQEGNTYINIKCRKCGASAKLGLYKSGGFFWHKFEKYVKKEDKV